MLSIAPKLSVVLLCGSSVSLNLFSEIPGRNENPVWTSDKWKEFQLNSDKISDQFFWALEHEDLFKDPLPPQIASTEERRRFTYYQSFLAADEPEKEHQRPFPDQIGSSAQRFYQLCEYFLGALQLGSPLTLEFTTHSKIHEKNTGGLVVRSIRPDGTGTVYIMVADLKNGKWIHRNHTWILAWD